MEIRDCCGMQFMHELPQICSVSSFLASALQSRRKQTCRNWSAVLAGKNFIEKERLDRIVRLHEGMMASDSLETSSHVARFGGSLRASQVYE